MVLAATPAPHTSTIGHDIEQLVARSLQELPGWISKIIHTAPHSMRDRAGKDLIVVLKNGINVFVQIKRSMKRALRFMRRSAHVSRLITVVVVSEHDKPETIRERILSSVYAFIQKFNLERTPETLKDTVSARATQLTHKRRRFAHRERSRPIMASQH